MTHKLLIVFFLFILIWSGPARVVMAAEAQLPKDLPQGWSLVEGPQHFDRKSLFKRIDGQADLYLKYGFRTSVFTAYQNRKSPDRQIEIDLYDMGNVLQAFGIFSRFRTEDHPAGIGLDSFLDDRSLLFYQGRYFVMLYATEPNLPELKTFGRSVSSGIAGSSSPPKEIGYFPSAGLRAGSIQYLPEALLGHQFLGRGFQATYMEDVNREIKAGNQGKDQAESRGREAQIFLAMFEKTEAAKGALERYRSYLTSKGKVLSKSYPDLGDQVLTGEDPYKGSLLVVRKNSCLLGAAGFEKEEEAINRLIEMMKKMRPSPHK